MNRAVKNEQSTLTAPLAHPKVSYHLKACFIFFSLEASAEGGRGRSAAVTEPDAPDSLSGKLIVLIFCQDSLALKAAPPV